MTREAFWRMTRLLSASFVAVVLLYIVFVRPWQLRWGATEIEVAQRMPGDDFR